MEQDIILKTDRAGRARTPRARLEQIVAEWVKTVRVKRNSSCTVHWSDVRCRAEGRFVGILPQNAPDIREYMQAWLRMRQMGLNPDGINPE